MAGTVRQPIDIAALEKWMNKNVAEIKVPLDVKQFGFGQSNPTYQLTSPSGARHVLRKKPPGTMLASQAHKVEREYRVLEGLQSTAVPVPRALRLCEDASVIGTPFYLMTFLDGRVIEDPAMPGVTAPERRAMWLDAVRVLARLHSVDPAAVGLTGFGRPQGFYRRQVATWRAICDVQARTRDVDTRDPVGVLPHMDDLMRFFAQEHLQPKDRGTLIHGDYKIDNLVFHQTEPRVIGILDWEMSTIGHPLSDLANLLQPWQNVVTMSPESPLANPGFLPGATPGMPTLEELQAAYHVVANMHGNEGSQSTAEARARELRWAQAFSTFRLAAICQGIAARHAQRQASSAMAERVATMRNPLAEGAWRIVRGLGEGEGPRL